jgi:hypothetical protein
MNFYLHTGNHNNFPGIADTISFLKCALQDCGHTAYISPGIVPGKVHIVMEAFVEQKHLDAVIDGYANGARYILIGTEPIINGCFNRGIVDQHHHYSNGDYWQTRFQNFVTAAKYAEVIWVLDSSMIDEYQRTFAHLPVRFLPHGHVNHFDTVPNRPESERDIDFYFSGAVTAYREGILRALASTHTLMFNHPRTSEYLRLDFLSRAKVCLSLRLSERNDIPSVSRMHFHLLNKSYLLHERYALPCALDPFVLHVPPERFLEWACAALEVPNRREIAEARFEQFKLSMPMTDLLPPLLDEALARGTPPSLRVALSLAA